MHIKKQLKKMKSVCDSKVIYNYEEVISIATNADVISFDIFDTLVKRNVQEPSDVFQLVEDKYNLMHSSKIMNFSSKRILAEKLARNNSDSEEISIEEIYNTISGYEESLRIELMKLELEVEYDISCPNLNILPFIVWCREQNKKIVCTSDMYLDKSFIRKILDKCGFSDIEDIFVSSEFKKTKSKGTLYDVLIKTMKTTHEKIFHIGDSKHSDYEMAMKKGLKAYRIPMKFNNRKSVSTNLIVKKDRFKFQCLQAFIDNNLDAKKNSYYKYGFEKFGMLLWGFSSWLYKDLKARGISKVYFFSRDGHIMKKAFDILYGEDKNIKSYYLEVSRRSLRVPILWMDSRLETLLNMISPSMMIPLISIFDGVGLNIYNYKEVLERYGFNVESKFYRNKIEENQQLKKLYEEIRPEFLKKSKEEFDNLIAYLDQMDVKNNFAIVDIGWSGGMQRYLSEALDKLKIPNDIYGYYFGVADYVKRNTAVCPLKLQGYIFDFHNDKEAKDLRSSFVGLFETLYLEQGGSVRNYKNVNGEFKAQRYDYEYCIDGVIQQEALYVNELQQGTIEFIRKINESKVFSDMNFNSKTLFSAIYSSGAHPTKEDIKMFGDFRFFDEGKEEYLARPQSIYSYFKQPSLFKQDFLQSRWKVGFMKRLFRIKLPYEKIYKALLLLK